MTAKHKSAERTNPRKGGVEELEAMLRASECRMIPNSRLPSGWSESRPGGMATNRCPETGGIVDIQIGGDWFVVPNREDAPVFEGFHTRDEAFSAYERFLAA